MCLLLSISCDKQDNEVFYNSPKNQIIFGLHNTGSRSVEQANLPTSSLGAINSTKEIKLILSNGSNKDVFDVNLSTNSNKLEVKPQKISIVPNNTFLNYGNGIGFLPVISLKIIHGKNSSGIGDTELLPMGKNYFELYVTGKIVEGLDTIQIQETISFSVVANVMNFVIHKNESKQELQDYDTTYFVDNPIRSFIKKPYYHINPTQNISIENTGNVSIRVYSKILTRKKDIYEPFEITKDTVEIAPEEKKLIAPSYANTSYYSYWIKLIPKLRVF